MTQRTRAHEPRALLPGPDPDAAALLGGAGLRHPAALRHGGGRRHLPPGHDLAGAGPEALARRLCAALAPAQGRALWREPQPAAALLPVPGDPEAEPAGPAGALSRLAGGDRHRHARCTTSASSRTIGRARRWAPGASAGNAGATAWKCRSSPISSRSPASNARRSRANSPTGSSASPCICRASRSIYDLNFNGLEGDRKVTYGDVFLQAEQEYLAAQFRVCRYRDAVPPFPRCRGRLPRIPR